VEARQRAPQRMAWLLTGDWALAEDHVQTALVRSWPRWERIRRGDDPEIHPATFHPGRLTPISTATNTPGKPIPVRPGYPSSIAITPQPPAPLGADLRERGWGGASSAMPGVLSVLAELQRAVVVASTNDRLASARARGRAGGQLWPGARPPRGRPEKDTDRLPGCG
jgi:hypothetical protein